MRQRLLMVTLLAFASSAWANEVIVESRPIASWQQERADYRSADKWLHLQRDLEVLQQEVQNLRGQLEENQHALSLMKQSMQERYLDLDNRLSDLQKSTPPVAVDLGSLPAVMPEPVQESITLPADERQAYDMGYNFLQAKEYTQALAVFQAHLTTFPDSHYKPNVYYWLGEIYLLGGQSEEADSAFGTVVEHFPQHPKAADALLKRGYVQFSLENWPQARAYFNDVLARFEGSSAARLAQARLVQMSQQGM